MKLLAVTYNYIGPGVMHCLPNKEIVNGENVIIPVSGEWYLKDHPMKATEADGPQAIRRYLLEKIYSEDLLRNQMPDILLVYVGMGDDGNVTQPVKFAQIADDYCSSVEEIHLVWPALLSRRRELYRHLGLWSQRRRPSTPFIHFSESTGNLTMNRLINEFRTTGKIQDPAEYRLPT